MLTVGKIADVLKGRLIRGCVETPVTGTSIDTRTLERGHMFVALRGSQTDGHKFVKHAFEKGAACALVEHPCEYEGAQIVVTETLSAFQTLARWFRGRFDIPVIGITGSAGKTTTKECLGTLLGINAKGLTGHANWNNHLGVPLNVTRIKSNDAFLVLELGANHEGEISFLCGIARPTVGVITGIYPVHLEGFGSLEGVYRAKLELADHLEGNSGTLVVNGDDPELVRQARDRKIRIVTFGSSKACDFSISNVYCADGFLSFRVNGTHVFKLEGFGGFNANNALAAIATAASLGHDLGILREKWTRLPAIPGRFRVRRWETEGIVLVDDAYNANPRSFGAAIESFVELSNKAKRRVVVAGAMLELGEAATRYHEALGEKLASSDVELLVGVGDLSRHTVEAYRRNRGSKKAVFCENYNETVDYLLPIIQDGDHILIKGSHGIGLDNLVREIERKFDHPSVTV